MSSSSNRDTLIATAVAAAAAGAAVAYTAVKINEKKNSDAKAAQKKADDPSEGRGQRSSYIMNDSRLTADSRADSGILFPHNHEEKMRRRIAARVSVEEENMTPRNSVTVRVPATSANVGPGCKSMNCIFRLKERKNSLTLMMKMMKIFCKRNNFTHIFVQCLRSPDDCIGMAVDLWSEITVSRADKFEITAEGEGAEEMPKDETNLMVVGLKAAFQAANKPVPTLKYHAISRIPYARGLGSSSAAIVAGIIAGLVLAGHRLPCWGSEALLQIAAGIEVCAEKLFPIPAISFDISSGQKQTHNCTSNSFSIKNVFT